MTQDNLLIDGLRAAGARITAQRIAICRWLEGNDRHPTASNVYAALNGQFPTMSLSTVYNTLSTLVDLNLLHEVGPAPDGSMRYDPNTQPHLNLVCTRCGRIIDAQEAAPAVIGEVASRYGFTAAECSIVIYGTCPDCQHAES
jgi:Fur family peroxide stress response transcriptional regulator